MYECYDKSMQEEDKIFCYSYRHNVVTTNTVLLM